MLSQISSLVILKSFISDKHRIQVVCNGTQIVDWRDREPERIKSGPIGLQLHSNDVPQEVHFANLEIEAFPEDALTTLTVPKVTQGMPDQPEIPSPVRLAFVFDRFCDCLYG